MLTTIVVSMLGKSVRIGMAINGRGYVAIAVFVLAIGTLLNWANSDIKLSKAATPLLPSRDISGTPIDVPSDPKAHYRLLRWSKMENGNREGLTKRVGPIGTTFARRELNCRTMEFRYLAEGDSLDQVEQSAANADDMAPMTQGSISSYVGKFVCKQ